ncbi:MAG: biotin transporter BioY [Planctomycetota bacterium]
MKASMKAMATAAGSATSTVGRTSLARPLTLRAGLVLAGMAVLTVGAWLSVPFYPVPLTMQTLAVLLVGGLLGPTLGVSAVAGYLAIGLMGAPVFHNGLGGLAILAGPTGGYLVGFLPAAFLMGLAVRWARTATGAQATSERRADRGPGAELGRSSARPGGWRAPARELAVLAAGAVLASVAIYVLGVPWLALFTGGSLRHAAAVGAVPFVLGDLLKAAVAVGAVRLGGAALSRRGLLPF